MTRRTARATRWLPLGIVALALIVSGCSSTPGSTPTSGDDGVERGVVYREVDGKKLKLDACLPDGDGPHPAVVVVHGGAFEAGDRTTMTDACRQLAGIGFATFAVDYRLVPAVYPAQAEDVAAAVTWLREPEQVESFGLDGSVSLLGSSAGSIIALSAAAALAEEGAPVSSVVALSSASDFSPPTAGEDRPPADLEKVVLAYLGCTDIDDCAVAEDASPLTHAADLPPTLLIHGSKELIPLDQAEKLAAALEAAGVSHELIVVPGSKHGLALLDDSTRSAIAEFLDTNTSP